MPTQADADPSEDGFGTVKVPVTLFTPEVSTTEPAQLDEYDTSVLLTSSPSTRLMRPPLRCLSFSAALVRRAVVPEIKD